MIITRKSRDYSLPNIITECVMLIMAHLLRTSRVLRTYPVE